MRHERPLDIINLPPEDALIFRFGESLLADCAVVWFEGASLVWVRRGVRRAVSLYLLREVEAYHAVLLGRDVRHIALKPLDLGELSNGLIPAQLTFQDQAGALFDRSEPDFDAFATELGARLLHHRPSLPIKGNAGMLSR
jgi:hypothetical protein